jgi:hypothetical protein
VDHRYGPEDPIPYLVASTTDQVPVEATPTDMRLLSADEGGRTVSLSRLARVL